MEGYLNFLWCDYSITSKCVCMCVYIQRVLTCQHKDMAIWL